MSGRNKRVNKIVNKGIKDSSKSQKNEEKSKETAQYKDTPSAEAPKQNPIRRQEEEHFFYAIEEVIKHLYKADLKKATLIYYKLNRFYHDHFYSKKHKKAPEAYEKLKKMHD